MRESADNSILPNNARICWIDFEIDDFKKKSAIKIIEFFRKKKWLLIYEEIFRMINLSIKLVLQDSMKVI